MMPVSYPHTAATSTTLDNRHFTPSPPSAVREMSASPRMYQMEGSPVAYQLHTDPVAYQLSATPMAQRGFGASEFAQPVAGRSGGGYVYPRPASPM
jgi:hypothetical protein